MNIKVNCQNSILINQNIYVDPFQIEGNNKAKYIFITHPHFDHFSIDDIKKILTKDTILVCPKSMQKDVQAELDVSPFLVEPNKKYSLEDISFETFNAYNLNKNFHPKANEWVGYTLLIDGERVTIVGDSDATPELEKIKTDILLIPIGGYFTMNPAEAAEVTNLIHPKKVIPTHYGDIIGEKIFGKVFESLVDNKIICDLQL